jgi:hypothetical protein
MLLEGNMCDCVAVVDLQYGPRMLTWRIFDTSGDYVVRCAHGCHDEYSNPCGRIYSEPSRCPTITG